MYWNRTRHLIAVAAIAASLWISINALNQTRIIYPGETASQAFRSLLFGRPVLSRQICPAEVHDRYVAEGPDGKQYPTWHPPVDLEDNCYFDHEHGSDPRSYVGFENSGMPVFGYTSHSAGINETHAGFKVYVTNDDWNGRAWMIVLHQDTSDPGRAFKQYATLDWHISSVSGEELVSIRIMADFGFAVPNCKEWIIPGSAREYAPGERKSQKRVLPTIDCATEKTYESWDSYVDVAGVFIASPVFDVDNSSTAIDPQEPERVHRICEYRPMDEGCDSSINIWTGTRRGVIRPGQYVDNQGPEVFYTDPFGIRLEAETQGAIRQYVTRYGWDTRYCCGAEVVFRIQTYSAGVYIAAPIEPSGSAEFGVGIP